MSGLRTIPARRGKATFARKGQKIKVINTHGEQVVDSWAFAQHDLREFMSMEHTRATLTKMRPQIGDALYSNRRRTISRLSRTLRPVSTTHSLQPATITDTACSAARNITTTAPTISPPPFMSSD